MTVKVFWVFLHTVVFFRLLYQIKNGFCAPWCMSVSLDQSHTADSWPISEPLLLTNKISKPIIYVCICEWLLDCMPLPPHAVTFLETQNL